jgi:hypothetical protein
MAVLHQYDYIFAVTTIFAFLDAWNIGTHCLSRLLEVETLADPLQEPTM